MKADFSSAQRPELRLSTRWTRLFLFFALLLASLLPGSRARAAAGPGPAPAAPAAAEAETVGGGTDATPAVGPAASYDLGKGFTLVKNWNWGTNGTIRTMTDMTREFNYHDQFNTIGNGENYGSRSMAADKASSIVYYGPNGPVTQRVEDPQQPVRQLFGNYLRTYLVPLDGATRIKPNWHNVGDGSFAAKWQLPKAGSALGRDLVWETRMRYVVPQQYWWALWICANPWTPDKGPEFDLVEGFGYDNGCDPSCTNFDGRYWHSNSIGGQDEINYGNWPTGMATVGFTAFDPTQYHTWTLVYHKDDSYDMYCDGVRVQGGKSYLWKEAQNPGGKPVDVTFLFDAAWGHTQIKEVNNELDAAILKGTYYEFDYSRVYLGPTAAPSPPPAALRPAENPTGTGAGLRYAYYETAGLSALPDFTKLTPVASGTVGTPALTPRQRDDNFAFRYTGYVTVPTDGTYTFYTTSDDGSRLFIGDQLVVDNDGLHGPQERSGTIGLRAGTHALTVTFFERDGGQALGVSYAGPGLSKQTLPAAAYSSLAGPSTTAAPVSGGVYRLVARHSGKALDVDGNSAAQGAKVQQWKILRPGPAQAWVIDLQSDGTYTLTHQGTNQRLDVAGNGTADGAAITQYTANDSDAQRWVITPTTAGYYKLVHKGTADKCLDVSGGESALADGAAVMQWGYWGGLNQQWKLERLDDPAAAAARAASSPTALSSEASPLSAYPNPSRGRASLTFATSRAQRVSVYVHDAQGHLVSLLTVPVQAGRTDFPLPVSLPAGTYFVRARLDGQQQHFTLKVE